MSEWWTYTPADFLLFSPATYRRLFELYNRDVWPAQAVALALGVAVLVLLGGSRPQRSRAVAAVLAACWAWIAWAFLLERYATINWAAVYFAAAFGLEAALLLWTGAIRGRIALPRAAGLRGRAGRALVLYALLVQPLVGLFAGRKWSQAEIFGMAPDPTVVATLGVLLAAGGGRVRLLWVVPLLWCGVSGMFLWAMAAPDALALPLAGLASVLFAVAAARRRRGSAPIP